MSLKRRNGPRAIAALLLFSIVQVGLQVGFAEPTVTTTAIAITPQTVARLTTRNNQPITVNGLSASTGASIFSGATIETGADQSATVNLGAFGTVDVSPNTKFVLTFDDQGNFKALVTTGCVKVAARTNATGEIATDQGSHGKTNPATGGVLEMCNQAGAAPVVGPGVAANAGAGAGAPAGAAAAGGGGLFGLGVPATVAIIGAGTAAGITPVFFQDNPSGPSN